MSAKGIKLLLSVCLTMVVLHVINAVFNGALLAYGIYPHEPATLPHIFTAPLIHGGWEHLLNNLIGMSVFGALVLIRGPAFFVQSSFIIVILTGILVWLFARPAMHIGASGWIFGLWSLSIAIAWFQRNILNIVVAVFVAFFYGGMIWGVMPHNHYVSFESHFFGALSGVFAAYLMSRKGRNARR